MMIIITVALLAEVVQSAFRAIDPIRCKSDL